MKQGTILYFGLCIVESQVNLRSSSLDSCSFLFACIKGKKQHHLYGFKKVLAPLSSIVDATKLFKVLRLHYCMEVLDACKFMIGQRITPILYSTSIIDLSIETMMTTPLLR